MVCLSRPGPAAPVDMSPEALLPAPRSPPYWVLWPFVGVWRRYPPHSLPKPPSWSWGGGLLHLCWGGQRSWKATWECATPAESCMGWPPHLPGHSRGASHPPPSRGWRETYAKQSCLMVRNLVSPSRRSSSVLKLGPLKGPHAASAQRRGQSVQGVVQPTNFQSPLCGGLFILQVPWFPVAPLQKFRLEKGRGFTPVMPELHILQIPLELKWWEVIAWSPRWHLKQDLVEGIRRLLSLIWRDRLWEFTQGSCHQVIGIARSN